MKVSFLLIILGFSQVLGRNYGSLTESKSEREDQIEGKSSEDNDIEMGEMAARPQLGQAGCPYRQGLLYRWTENSILMTTGANNVTQTHSIFVKL